MNIYVKDHRRHGTFVVPRLLTKLGIDKACPTGAKRIVGELLKLEIVVHKKTVAKYARQARKGKSG